MRTEIPAFHTLIMLFSPHFALGLEVFGSELNSKSIYFSPASNLYTQFRSMHMDSSDVSVYLSLLPCYTCWIHNIMLITRFHSFLRKTIEIMHELLLSIDRIQYHVHSLFFISISNHPLSYALCVLLAVFFLKNYMIPSLFSSKDGLLVLYFMAFYDFILERGELEVWVDWEGDVWYFAECVGLLFRNIQITIFSCSCFLDGMIQICPTVDNSKT